VMPGVRKSRTAEAVFIPLFMRTLARKGDIDDALER
jgi:hypothetical protein